MKYYFKTMMFVLVLIFSPAITKSQNSVSELVEEEKIDSLILSIKEIKRAKFYRNGKYYDSKMAAEHLRMKRSKAGERIKTAKQFIDNLASKSSFSGEDYKIVYDNGTEITTRTFFYNKLKTLECPGK